MKENLTDFKIDLEFFGNQVPQFGHLISLTPNAGIYRHGEGFKGTVPPDMEFDHPLHRKAFFGNFHLYPHSTHKKFNTIYADFSVPNYKVEEHQKELLIWIGAVIKFNKDQEGELLITSGIIRIDDGKQFIEALFDGDCAGTGIDNPAQGFVRISMGRLLLSFDYEGQPILIK